MSAFQNRRFCFILFILISIISCGKEKVSRRKIKLAPHETQTLSATENSAPTVIKLDMEERVSLAILTFENQTSDTSLAWLCQGITDMLIRDLSQSRYLKVITMQRIYDILKKMDIDSPCAISYGMLPTISEQTGVEAVLRGKFTEYKDSLLIEVQLYDVSSGEIIQEQRVAGLGLAQIFGMVDDLSQKIKQNIRTTHQSPVESDLAIADISTRSLEAYRYYSEGVNLAYKAYYGDAIHKFEMAIKEDPHFAMAQYWAGLIYTKLGKTGAAKQAIRQALAYADNTTAIEKMKIEWLAAANRGEYQLAFEKMQKIVDAFPDDKVSRYQLAGYHYLRKELKEAQHELDEVLKLDPEYAQAFILHSLILRDQGKYKQAIKSLQQCIALNPGDASPYHNLGELYQIIGDSKAAISAYREAIRLKPDFHYSILNLAHTYSKLSEYSKSIQTYRRALAVVPSEELKAEVYSGLAQVELLQGKYNGAITYIRQAIHFPTSNAEKASYLTMLAGIFLKKAQYDSVISLAEQAFTLQSPNIAAYHTLCNAYAEQGELAKAQEIADKVDRFIRTSHLELYRNIHYRMCSKIAAAKGDYPNAIRLANKILAANPNASSIYFDIGKYYFENADYSHAIDSYHQYLNKNKNQNLVNYYLALAFYEDGKKRKAKKTLQHFLRQWKDADSDIPEINRARQLIDIWENKS